MAKFDNFADIELKNLIKELKKMGGGRWNQLHWAQEKIR